MMINQATIDLVKKWESLHDGDLTQIGLQPKMDAVGLWTEGYGKLIDNPKTKGLLKGKENKDLAYSLATITTEKEADADLIVGLRTHAIAAKKVLGEGYWELLTENMQGALTSFVYNCGTHNRATAKPYKIFQEIRNYLDGKSTKEQLTKYWESSVIRSQGQILKGLINRRADEVKLFFS